MSYNGYNGYSPYYSHSQQRAPKSETRNQYPYQSSPAQNTYQPQYPNTNAQYPSSASPTYPSTQYNEPSRFSGAETSGSAAYHNSSTNYGYSAPRPAENITGLGSLAYASSLRQDQPSQAENSSLQRVADYNKSSSYTDSQRSDSRGSTGKYPVSTAPASHVDTHHSYQNYANQQQTTHSANWSQFPSVNPSRTNQKPPSRPSSVQNTHVTQANSSVNQSPDPTSTSAYKPPTAISQRSQTPAAQPPRPASTHTSWASQNGHPPAAYSANRASPAASQAGRSQRDQTGNNTASLPPVNGSAHQSEISPPHTASQNPTTIDPNKVFNEYEYQRRQSAIAAEAKAAKAAKDKAALEADARKRQAEQAEARQKQAEQAATAQKDESVKEQMEAEMKLMLEKMRDYKSKDPSLFSQIWEQVKKAQPPSSNALPASKEVNLPSPRVTIASPQLPTPAASSIAHPAELDPNSQLITEAVPQEIDRVFFDRGKYPAARRKGKLYKARVSQGQTDGSNSSPPQPGLPHAGPPPVGPPLGYVSAINGAASAPGPPEGYVHAAGVGNTLREPAQKVWVSGKGNVQVPKPQTQAQPPAPTTQSSVTPSPSTSIPRPTGQTHWPEGDKWALALAARDTLLAHPVNKGKEISSSDIRGLLDQGPSYDELCHILESKGFVVERTAFAQQLLSAVPRLQAQRPSDQPAQNQTHTSNYQIQAVNGGGAAPVANMSDNFRNTFGQPRGGRLVSDLKGPVPPTKEQNAKKRSFADIVDLSADVDSDEEINRQRAEKMARLELSKVNEAEPVAGPAPEPVADKQPSSPAQEARATRLASPSGPFSAVQSDDDRMGISQFKNDSPQRERLRKAHVVQPLIRDYAARRSAYNPRTIARDILIVAGKHSLMPALNHHLDGLRTNFRHVDYNSDLSTINWALIDPAGPPPRKETPPRTEIAEKQVVGGKPEQTASEGPTAVVGPRKGAFAKNRSLGINSFMPPRPSFGVSPSQQQAPNPASRSDDVSMLSAGQSSVFPSRGPHSTPAKPLGDNSRIQQASSERKRRGRPPGAKNKGPRKSLTSLPQPAPTPSTPISTDMSIPNRPHPNTASPKSLKASVERSTPVLANPRNIATTPARPSGLRNEVSITPAAGFAVVIPSPSHAARSTSEILSNPIHITDSPAPKPKRQMYHCRWQDCPAELHNLETLRKHVRNHLNEFEDGNYQCLWEGCGKSKIGAANIDSEREPLEFQTAASWERHMDGRHIDHYAWKYGDGPSPHQSGMAMCDIQLVGISLTAARC